MQMQPAAVTCRPIEVGDLDAVASLLARGFPERGRPYWDRALQVLAERDTPDGYPRFGQTLQSGGACVGALLQIFSIVESGGGRQVRCNLSSWYVEPAYRGYAVVLDSRARTHKGVTYLNISPARHTWPILTVQGFRRYSEGQFACLPALTVGGRGVRVRDYAVGEAGHAPETSTLLDAHARYGLIVLVCEGPHGRAAFAFLPRDVKGVGRRVAQLAWCEDTAGFARHAGPLGRTLLRRGFPVVILDGCERVPGLIGRFFKDRAPKYYQGSAPPRLNDLAYTEAVLFGA
jgi:hypothetical protein